MYKKYFLLAILAISFRIENSAFALDGVLEENLWGSYIVYPKFEIQTGPATGARGPTTEIRIANNGSQMTYAKLNVVCPGIQFVNDMCAGLDQNLQLAPYEVKTINVSTLNPPCDQGYIAVFATNQSNIPVSYNKLSGSYQIRKRAKVETASALAIQSTQPQGNTLGQMIGNQRRLRFGSGDYKSLPTKLYTDIRLEDSNEQPPSKIVLLSLDVKVGMQNPPGFAYIDIPLSNGGIGQSAVQFICWMEVSLSDIHATFTQQGLGIRDGVMVVTPIPNCPITGGCPPIPVYDAAMLGIYSEYGLTGRPMSHNTEPTEAIFTPR